MTHDEHLSEETVNLYLDGELGENERTHVETHLRACAACQAEVDSLQELFFALDEMADAPAPDLVPGVVARIRPRTRLTALQWVIPALQGAAAVGLLAWGWVRLASYLTAAARALPLETLEQTEARAAQLTVLQAASARLSRAGTVEGVGRTVVEETRRIIDYHNARVYLLEPPDDVVPIAFAGTVGAYERGVNAFAGGTLRQVSTGTTRRTDWPGGSSACRPLPPRGSW